MKLTPFLEKLNNKSPALVTPFINSYFHWADKIAAEKPYFYGHWSLKWALSIILPSLKPIQQEHLIHHIASELAFLDNPEEVAQFNAIKLVALHPWRQTLNEYKNQVDVRKLNYFHAGDYKVVVNTTPNNLASMIFRKTNADAIIQVNPETQSAAISVRVNSPLNNLEGFKHYLWAELQKETGWKYNGNWPPSMFINYGIQSNTPTRHTQHSLSQLFTNYFKE